jgi:hypothetical protein
VGPRAGLDTEVRGKILSSMPGIEPRSPGRPARSQTLYRLSYPGLLHLISIPVNYAINLSLSLSLFSVVKIGLQQFS